MKLRQRISWAGAGAAAVLLTAAVTHPVVVRATLAPKRPEVEVLRAPEGGYQVQAVAGIDGTLHLVALRGDPGHADIFYSRRGADGQWLPSLRVNSLPESAVGMGTIRGPQLALGPNGRVHVVWFGSERAGGKASDGGAPLLYSRLNDAGDAFEPQRSLMRRSVMLDGGPSVAADARGVYVAWHGADAAAPHAGEPARRLWLARSTNAGRTFEPEAAVNTDLTGACACCSVKVFAAKDGRILVLYRAATQLPTATTATTATSATERDMCLLVSTDGGRRFTGARLDPWQINACPMSSESFVEGTDGVTAAWETEGRIRWRSVEPKRVAVAMIRTPPKGQGSQRHPVLAANKGGDLLLAWTEGTGWARGGDLAWQRYSRAGKPLGPQGRLKGGVPVWGLVAVAARSDGGFTLVH